MKEQALHMSDNRIVNNVDELHCTDCGRHIGWDSETGFTEYDITYTFDGVMPAVSAMLCEDCVKP